MRSRKQSFAIVALILGLLFIGTVATPTVNQVHAQPPQSTNVIVNPGFESQLTGWTPDVFDDGTYGDTITANSTLAHSGTYSARLDISNNSTSIKLGYPTTNSHIELIQYLPANTLFSNITDRPSGLSLWFYIQPKYAGYSIFEARIRAGSTAEMDYFFINPKLIGALSFANSTTGSEGGKPLKQFIFPAPPVNQWVHLARNLRQDWLAPLKLPNGTLVSDFNITDTFARFEADANFYMDPSNNVYAETAWVDDVAVYIGNTIPLPSFTFQDWTGGAVDSIVTWKMFNSSGVQVSLTPGTPVTSNLYRLKAYYHGLQIFSDPITPDIPDPVQLSMTPIDNSRSGFVAINNTLTGLAVTENTESQVAFIANGTGASLIIADIPTQPVTVIQNGDNTPSWTYNGTSKILSIQASSLGPFSISFRPVMTLPQFVFQDISGRPVGNAINPKIVNSQGVQEQPPPGSLVPVGAYTLRIYYQGYSVYISTITPSISSTIQLNMLPIGQSSNYVAFNSTVKAVSITQNDQNRITFTSSGTGPTLVVVKVPSRPISVEQNGAPISTWTYNSTSVTVAIQSASLGTFSLVFTNPAPLNLWLIVGILVVAVAVSLPIIFWIRKQARLEKHEYPDQTSQAQSGSPSDKYRKKKN